MAELEKTLQDQIEQAKADLGVVPIVVAPESAMPAPLVPTRPKNRIPVWYMILLGAFICMPLPVVLIYLIILANPDAAFVVAWFLIGVYPVGAVWGYAVVPLALAGSVGILIQDIISHRARLLRAGLYCVVAATILSIYLFPSGVERADYAALQRHIDVLKADPQEEYLPMYIPVGLKALATTQSNTFAYQLTDSVRFTMTLDIAGSETPSPSTPLAMRACESKNAYLIDRGYNQCFIVGKTPKGRVLVGDTSKIYFGVDSHVVTVSTEAGEAFSKKQSNLDAFNAVIAQTITAAEWLHFIDGYGMRTVPNSHLAEYEKKLQTMKATMKSLRLQRPFEQTEDAFGIAELVK